MVALAAAVLLPRFGGLRSAGIEVAARRLADGLTLTRERAILRGEAVGIEVDLERGAWRLTSGRERDGLVLPPRVRIRRVTTGDGVEVSRGLVTLALDPAGDMAALRVELADAAGRTAAVVLPPAGGRARVEVGDGR